MSEQGEILSRPHTPAMHRRTDPTWHGYCGYCVQPRLLEPSPELNRGPLQNYLAEKEPWNDHH